MLMDADNCKLKRKRDLVGEIFCGETNVRKLGLMMERDVLMVEDEDF